MTWSAVISGLVAHTQLGTRVNYKKSNFTSEKVKSIYILVKLNTFTMESRITLQKSKVGCTGSGTISARQRALGQWLVPSHSTLDSVLFTRIVAPGLL